MYRSHHKTDVADNVGSSADPRRSRLRGLTLAELLMAMTITAILSIVLGGLVLAVQTTRQHSEGLDTATSQAQAALDRVRYMVSQAGVYRETGQPTTLGLAVVTRHWNADEVPNILVVWSGGRNGGMADAGTQSRLPAINELVFYTADPANPGRFVEIVIPGDASTIDFQAADFAADIRFLIQSAGAETTRLCDRIRICGDPQSVNGGTGGVWFDLRWTPDDDALSSVAPETTQWIELGWAQGIASSGQGLRQATLRVELQLERMESTAPGVDSKVSSIPFYGSASRRYVYEP